MPVEVQAADALRDSIVTGVIPAGARITEVQVSSQMNLSRATIRTAFHQLAQEGLLSLVPYTGWTVVSLSPDDVWELFTLRSALERLAAQLLARSIQATSVTRLKAAFAALTDECHSGGPSRIATADFALHKTIIEQTNHRRLRAQYALIEPQIRICIRSSDALIPESKTIIDQHKLIVNAILAGNAEDSGRLSEEHNLAEGAKLSAHLRDVEQEGKPAPERTPTKWDVG